MSSPKVARDIVLSLGINDASAGGEVLRLALAGKAGGAMNPIERLTKDMRDVALFNFVLTTRGVSVVSDLVMRHPELRRVAALWAEAVAGTMPAAAGASKVEPRETILRSSRPSRSRRQVPRRIDPRNLEQD